MKNNQIGIIKTSIDIKSPIVPINFTNAIAFGETGSGKTSSFILPNIEERIKKNHGILIYDFKGNMHQQIKLLAKKHNRLSDVFEIGKDWGESINLIEDLTLDVLKKFFLSISKKEKGNDFWNIAAGELLENLYIILKSINEIINNNINFKFNPKINLNNFEFKLSTISKNIRNAESLSLFIKEIKKFYKENYYLFNNFLIENIENELSKENTRLKYSFLFKHFQNLENSLFNISNYSNYNPDFPENGGKYDILLTLNSLLMNSFSKKLINNNINNINIYKELSNNKIIIIDVQEIDEINATLINHSIYERLIHQTKNQDKNKITIFIDEAHKIISDKNIPETSICRENNFEYILSVQNEELLNISLGISNTKSLIANTLFIINYKNINFEKLDNFEYILDNIKYIAKPIFFSKDEINIIEYEYQKEKGILQKYKLPENYYLISDNYLKENLQCYAYNKNNKSKEVINLIFESPSYNHFFNNLKKYNFDKENNYKDLETLLIKYKNDFFNFKQELFRKYNHLNIEDRKKIHSKHLENSKNYLKTIKPLYISILDELNEIDFYLKK